ncbi:hypothetical protein N7474_004725 [Penicillium riverlandense]|uniref:uncharacterized protein n=1 Tax=Penicillium riverlandense TaxID=1903569 RepID=UPI0025493DEB|nr:uncharacterized protein N7474_004725 [Penicillium riverlandense]KAJ5819134.1 hypothetical protein N7474_004725 [Penicillium riverlandense]
MPSPATPHRSSNRGGSAKSTPTTRPLDIGQPLGVHDTNSVRSRVRTWQQQGGGVVAVDDPCGAEDEENNANKAKPKPNRVNVDRVDKAVNKPAPAPAPVARKRSHSTPRKRVISDEHWKRSRAMTQTPSRNQPAPNRISQYTVNDPTGSPRARKEDRRDEKDRDKDREPPPRYGARRYTGPSSRSPVRDAKPSTSRNRLDSFAGSDYGTGDSKIIALSVSDIPDDTRRESPPPEDTDWARSEADFSELSKRRSGAVGQPARKLSKPPKGGIFAHMIDESKKMFGRPDPDPEPPKPAQPVNRGSKIEAWLSETPDPFLDDATSTSDTKTTRSRRSKTLTESDRDAESSLNSEPRPKSSHIRYSKAKDISPETDKSYKKSEREVSSNDKRRSTETSLTSPKSPPRNKEYKTTRYKITDGKASPYVPEPSLSDGSEVSGHNAPVPLGRRKPFPSTGFHQLSTIASVETLSTLTEGAATSPEKFGDTEKNRSIMEEEEEKQDQFDPDSLPAVSSQLKRRLTTNDDLMSVLSGPTSRRRSIRSARSIRTNKSRLENATVTDLLQELAADEAKYMRELKTLVGGVIPVLLTCVLSRSDSAIAAGLFQPSMDPKDDMNFSKPIVNMGVAIERLKTLHKRIPQDNVDALLTWAQGAQRVYREYLRAWRLGFKDVIVNLAPLEEGENTNAETKSIDEGLERDENGDVIGSDGEKVDVAYLLKRPLVRLKHLAKSFKGINMLQPSQKAEDTAVAYQSLVVDARKRAREERARLEDESAARIDATRARDPMTLGVCHGVTVDQDRRVRARDFFNLSIYHSTGQLVDCRAELLYRDNPSDKGPGGDLLICELDHSDRWLLFPPMDLRCVSARKGDVKGELVVMLRSAPDSQKYWQELLSLRIDDESIRLEWLQLLGSDPVPPSICRSQSFISRAKQHRARRPAANDSPPRHNQSDVDIPIGEKATSKRRSVTPKEQYSEPSTVSSAITESRSSVYSTATRETDYTTGGSELSTKPSRPGLPLLPSTTSSVDKTSSGLKRSKAKRLSRYGESSASETVSPKPVVPEQAGESPSMPSRFYGEDADTVRNTGSPREKRPQKTARQDSPEVESPRLSTVPSTELPMIPKIRSSSSQTHLSSPSTLEPEEDYPPLESLPDSDVPETPTKARRRSQRKSKKEDESPPPPPPPHRSPSPATGKIASSPVLTPTGPYIKRRGSSPLKHEYEPSTASDSYSDSDTSTVRHYSYSSSYTDSDYSDSDSSSPEDDYLEPPKPRVSASSTTGTSSLSPSNSASQAGYRTVPLQPAKSSKAIAFVFAWSNKGTWETLFPDECNVIVSPGLIEAFKMGVDPNTMSPERGDKTSRSSRPLISLELTPLVPIRRGTAIDISIRSPPTERSRITFSNNIMFRSRGPEECDALYGLINQARINNPTYIALQNARGPFQDQPLPSFEPATAKPSSGGWFGWPRRRRSYRASASPRSLAEASESSVGTMSSAFSALKRFGAGSKAFNISRSTVTSRTGREGSMSSSANSGSNHSPSSGIGRIAAAIKGVDGIGLSNAKIRLYVRESASKWRDMGAARLTIMPAPPKNPPSRPSTAVSSRSDSSTTAAAQGDRETSQDSATGSSPPASGATSPRREPLPVDPEKRILIRGKTRGETLLDVCLPEGAFERVARTGIAVSVREENEGAIAKKGGVTAGSQRVYMIQMKSEAEATYTFGLVGKLRY